MSWAGGLAEWVEGRTAYLSVVFTWRLPDAFSRAIFYRSQGLHVVAGGPATFARPAYLAKVAELQRHYPDAIVHQNPQATMASRGCPVGCWFCIVPKYEGSDFTLLPDFTPRPILCDNNLSALPDEYQRHIIARYQSTETPLLDANSGFEPRTFTDEVYHRWRSINRGPWRFAYDDEDDGPHVERVMQMLSQEPARKKRVYVLIGTAPVAACLDRIERIVSLGGEPHAQPFIPLNSLDKRPSIRHDWTPRLLTSMARWANRRLWRYVSFQEYNASAKSQREDHTGQLGLSLRPRN